jgi:hypothetical protein
MQMILPSKLLPGPWFESLLFPGATGFIVGGPLGAIGGTTVGILMAYQFEKNMEKDTRCTSKESKKSTHSSKYRAFSK